jgi:hypothetical protein
MIMGLFSISQFYFMKLNKLAALQTTEFLGGKVPLH